MITPVKWFPRLLPVALLLLLGSGALVAQTPAGDESPGETQNNPTGEVDGRPLCVDVKNDAQVDSNGPANADPGADPADAQSAEDCIAATPDEALSETVDPGEMRATMRRFVPSEQISEDSSVAFPNDI